MKKSYIIELIDILENNPVIYDMMKQCPYEILEKAYLEQLHVTRLCYVLGYYRTFLNAQEFIEYRKQISE